MLINWVGWFNSSPNVHCYVYLLTEAFDPDVRRTRPAASVNPFTLAQKGKMTKEKEDDCHRAVTNFVVKGLLPFSTVEAPWWR